MALIDDMEKAGVYSLSIDPNTPDDQRDAAYYLALQVAIWEKNKPKRHTVRDHNFNLQTNVCGRCGISLLDFHAIPFGLGFPCKTLKT